MIRRLPFSLLSASPLRRGYVSLKLAVLTEEEHAGWLEGSAAANKRLESNPKELLRFLSSLSEATTSSWAPRIHSFVEPESVQTYKQILQWEAEILDILKPSASMQPRFPILNMADGQKVRGLVQNILNINPTYGGLIDPSAKDVADAIFVKASVRAIFEDYFLTGYKLAPNQRQLRYFQAAQTGEQNAGILRDIKNRRFKQTLEEDVSKLNAEELLALFEINWAVEPFKKTANHEALRNRFETILGAALSKADLGFFKTEEGLQVVSRKLETKTFARLMSRICDKHCSPSLIKLMDQYIRQNINSLGSEDLTMSLYGLARNTVNDLHLDWVNNKLASLQINNSGSFALTIALASKLYEIKDERGDRTFFGNQETFVQFLNHMLSRIEHQDTIACRYNARFFLVAIEKLASLSIPKELIPTELVNFLRSEFIQHQDSYESQDDQVQMTYFLIELGVTQDYGRIFDQISSQLSEQADLSPEQITLGLWLLYRVNRLKKLPVPRRVREIVASPVSRDYLKKALDTDRLRRRYNEVVQMEADYDGEAILSGKELQQEELIARAIWSSKSFARSGWVVQQDLRASRQQPREEDKPKIEEVEFTLAPEPSQTRKPLRFERSWRNLESESEDD